MDELYGRGVSMTWKCANCGCVLKEDDEGSAQPLCISCADKPHRTVAEIRAEVELQFTHFLSDEGLEEYEGYDVESAVQEFKHRILDFIDGEGA